MAASSTTSSIIHQSLVENLAASGVIPDELSRSLPPGSFVEGASLSIKDDSASFLSPVTAPSPNASSENQTQNPKRQALLERLDQHLAHQVAFSLAENLPHEIAAERSQQLQRIKVKGKQYLDKLSDTEIEQVDESIIPVMVPLIKLEIVNVRNQEEVRFAMQEADQLLRTLSSEGTLFLSVFNQDGAPSIETVNEHEIRTRVQSRFQQQGVQPTEDEIDRELKIAINKAKEKQSQQQGHARNSKDAIHHGQAVCIIKQGNQFLLQYGDANKAQPGTVAIDDENLLKVLQGGSLALFDFSAEDIQLLQKTVGESSRGLDDTLPSLISSLNPNDEFYKEVPFTAEQTTQLRTFLEDQSKGCALQRFSYDDLDKVKNLLADVAEEEKENGELLNSDVRSLLETAASDKRTNEVFFSPQQTDLLKVFLSGKDKSLADKLVLATEHPLLLKLRRGSQLKEMQSSALLYQHYTGPLKPWIVAKLEPIVQKMNGVPLIKAVDTDEFQASALCPQHITNMFAGNYQAPEVLVLKLLYIQLTNRDDTLIAPTADGFFTALRKTNLALMKTQAFLNFSPEEFQELIAFLHNPGIRALEKFDEQDIRTLREALGTMDGSITYKLLGLVENNDPNKNHTTILFTPSEGEQLYHLLLNFQSTSQMQKTQVILLARKLQRLNIEAELEKFQHEVTSKEASVDIQTLNDLSTILNRPGVGKAHLCCKLVSSKCCQYSERIPAAADAENSELKAALLRGLLFEIKTAEERQKPSYQQFQNTPSRDQASSTTPRQLHLDDELKSYETRLTGDVTHDADVYRDQYFRILVENAKRGHKGTALSIDDAMALDFMPTLVSVGKTVDSRDRICDEFRDLLAAITQFKGQDTNTAQTSVDSTINKLRLLVGLLDDNNSPGMLKIRKERHYGRRTHGNTTTFQNLCNYLKAAVNEVVTTAQYNPTFAAQLKESCGGRVTLGNKLIALLERNDGRCFNCFFRPPYSATVRSLRELMARNTTLQAGQTAAPSLSAASVR